MCNCRRRRCLALNNSCDEEKREYETLCNNVTNSQDTRI